MSEIVNNVAKAKEMTKNGFKPAEVIEIFEFDEIRTSYNCFNSLYIFVKFFIQHLIHFLYISINSF